MKKMILLTLFFTPQVFAGALPSFPGPEVDRVSCEGAETSLRQNGSLFIDIKGSSALLETLVNEGLVQEGYLKNLDLTKDLTIVSGEHEVSLADLQTVTKSERLGREPKILNNFDFALNKQLSVIVSGQSVSELSLIILRTIPGESRCVEFKDNGFFKECVRAVVIRPEQKIIEATVPLNLGSCKRFR